jgi:hypothetical protein
MALTDLQWSYRGLTFGEGTTYFVNTAEGFEGFDTRTSDADQPRGDGGIRGLDYVAARTLAFELALIETADLDGSIYEGLYAAVRAAFAPSLSQDYPLVFKRPGLPERQINCRPIQLSRSEKFLRFNRFGFPPVVLRAVDPRIYATTVQTVSVPVYAASIGGVDLPAELPLDFTGGAQIEVQATNNGTANAYPLIRFYGPTTGTVTGVTLTNSTTGDVLQISTTITTGQILTADMTAAVTGSNSLVVSLDGSSRYGSWALPRTAFPLAPGSNSLRFQVTGTSTDALCAVTWSDTWIS